MRIVSQLACILTAIVLLGGCGGSSGEVAGMVTMDEQPLAEGEIIFEAEDGNATPEATLIKDGHYRLKVPNGKKIVRISASRPTAIPDPVMGAAARDPAVAKEFNIESTLRYEVKPGKHEGVNFVVQPHP